jgi:hypothetical protein
MRNNGERKTNICFTIGGEDYDVVTVHYEVSPAEPDVNWPGGITINSVQIDGNEVKDVLSALEMSLLEEKVSQDDAEAEADDADYQYEIERDRRAEGDW